MDHNDHVNLLRGGVARPGGIWADFGSGSGAFTLALADLIGPMGQIYSVDKDAQALRRQEQAMHTRFPDTPVHYLNVDFTRPLDFSGLDGIVTANALHFHARKDPIVQMLSGYLKPGGHFILVEYNVDQGNTWVPYPLSYNSWETLSRRNGFAKTRFLHSVPSRFLREIYSALSEK